MTRVKRRAEKVTWLRELGHDNAVAGLKSARIRDVTEADLDQIVRIQDDAEPGAGPISGGFLVSGYSREDYEWMLVRATTFVCVALADRILGFVVVLERTELPLSDGSQLAPVPFQAPSLVIKQVAVDTSCRRAGVGTILYREVMRRHHGEAMAATVVHEPRNEASITFHVQLGFVHVAQMPNENGGVSGLWIRLPDEDGLSEVMAAQYEQAVELYKHEDSLTWTKLQACVYITGAVAAAIGFSGGKGARVDNDLQGVIAVITAIATGSLALAIHAGTSYTAARKAAVCRIEQRLARFGGQLVVHQPHSALLRASPTRIVLRVVPLVLTAAWAVLAVYLFAR